MRPQKFSRGSYAVGNRGICQLIFVEDLRSDFLTRVPYPILMFLLISPSRDLLSLPYLNDYAVMDGTYNLRE